MKKFYFRLTVAALFAITGLHASAATLFSDEMTSGAAWGVNASGSDYLATFNYDYSSDGIPEAPNSQSGDAPHWGALGHRATPEYPLAQVHR